MKFAMLLTSSSAIFLLAGQAITQELNPDLVAARSFVHKASHVATNVVERVRPLEPGKSTEVTIGSDVCLVNSRSHEVASWRGLPSVASDHQGTLESTQAIQKSREWMAKMNLQITGTPVAVIRGGSWAVRFDSEIDGYPSPNTTSLLLNRATGEVWAYATSGQDSVPDHSPILISKVQAEATVRSKVAEHFGKQPISVKWVGTQYIDRGASFLNGARETDEAGPRHLRLGFQISFVLGDSSGFAFVDTQTGEILQDGINQSAKPGIKTSGDSAVGLSSPGKPFKSEATQMTAKICAGLLGLVIAALLMFRWRGSRKI
jgi:hypothetical protein